MGYVFLVLAGLIAVVPAGLAIIRGIGVPPEQGVLFGVSELTLAGILTGLAYQNRHELWLQGTHKLSRNLLMAGCAAAVLLTSYLFVYSACVVEHPLYGAKLLFPLWPSGKLADMIRRAGSRYGAVDKYGIAAVFDAISEMPGYSYAVALGTLLLLYAPPLAAACSMAFVLAFRYPSNLLRPSLSRGQSFDVFLCYNRADKLAVRAIANQLAANKIRYFLDENENPPGQAWTECVERALAVTPSFAVFLGPSGVGKWQAVEIQNITEARIARACSVIPVLLPDAPELIRLPMQLAGLTWVDFRNNDPDPVAELIRGIRAPAAIVPEDTEPLSPAQPT